MAKKSLFSKIGSVLQDTEMFERPRKKIPGKWKLYEYFVEEEAGLLHKQLDDLEKTNEFFDIEFLEGNFTLQSSISASLIPASKNGKWSVAKNFITLIDQQNFRDNIEFQFAFEKGDLKLLKKDVNGKIEFFGFFNR